MGEDNQTFSAVGVLQELAGLLEDAIPDSNLVTPVLQRDIKIFHHRSWESPEGNWAFLYGPPI
jgi:hypothetical protein